MTDSGHLGIESAVEQAKSRSSLRVPEAFDFCNIPGLSRLLCINVELDVLTLNPFWIAQSAHALYGAGVKELCDLINNFSNIHTPIDDHDGDKVPEYQSGTSI